MFTNPLPDKDDYRIFFTSLAEEYYIKRFAKDYKGRRWIITLDSIFQNLKRVHSMDRTQDVIELKHGDGCKLFKYDFSIAQSGTSPKASGNHCVVFLDINQHRQDVLLLYGKNDIPKNIKETDFIYDTIKKEFNDIWERLD